ncbi:MAG: tetratricopeptide repeat protein, partial [Euryarchaeota archaeon]|nr:tetratricopeptide repeat protein [Euryarchaeota archaeon]
MKVFQVPVLRNLQINPAYLEKPQTLPFDMPANKKEKILSLLLWGLSDYHPDFLALDYEAIRSVSEKRHVGRIKGIKVDKRTLLSVSVRSENELREVLESVRQIPSLMMVIDILDPGVPASRRWLFQLKNVVADAIRKTVYEDKRIDEKLLDGPTFDFCLKNFEDPIDVIDFLNLVISIRSENEETGEAIDEAFIAMVSDRISPLKPNWVKALFSLIVTDGVSGIQKLTNLSEEEIGKAIDELQMRGLVHNRSETPALPLYLKNLKKPGLLIGVIDRMKGKMEGEGFDEIKEFYFRIAKEINPKEEMVEQPLTRAEAVRAISYPALETDDPDKLILSLEAPFMGDVSKEIENPDRMIAIVNEVLLKTMDERIRGIALSVRALAYIKKGYLKESRRDIDEGSKINHDVLKISVPFYLGYGDLCRERANYTEAIECYNYALKSAEESMDKLRTSQALVGIAEVHLKQANHEGAEKLVREGLKVAEELGEAGKGVAAQALDLLGNIQYDLGNARSAIEYYEQALS